MLQRKKILYLITTIVFIYGIYLRWLNLTRPFLYDELWGLTHWVKLPIKESLMLFYIPNNHPLNSLFMKLAVHFWPNSLTMMRLHSFIAGIAIPLLAGGSAWLLTRRKMVVAMTVIFCAMNTGLIYYSQVARGYSIETMFIMLFLFLLLTYQVKTNKTKGKKIFIMSGMVLSFCLACFSQPTAILYLAPIMVLHTAYILIKQWQNRVSGLVNLTNIVRKNIILISGYAIITLFAIWMYIMHYSHFKAAVPEGQGIPVKSFTDFISAISIIAQKLFPWFIIIGLAGCLTLRKYRVFFLSGVAFIFPAFLAGIVIKFGPPRVYTPIAPVILMIAATGFYSLIVLTAKWRKYMVMLLPAVLTAYIMLTYQTRYINWAEVSFHRTVKWLDQYFPQGHSYHCYPPNVGMKIAMTYPSEVNNNIQRLYDNMPFLYADSDKPLKAIDISQNKGWVVHVKLPVTGIININNAPVSKDIKINVYRLKRLVNTNSQPDIIIADIPLQNANIVKAAGDFLCSGSGEWRLLNCWFKPKLKSKTGEKFIACQLISNNCLWSVKKLKDIERKSSGKIIFYTLVPVQQSELNIFGDTN